MIDLLAPVTGEEAEETKIDDSFLNDLFKQSDDLMLDFNLDSISTATTTTTLKPTNTPVPPKTIPPPMIPVRKEAFVSATPKVDQKKRPSTSSQSSLPDNKKPRLLNPPVFSNQPMMRPPPHGNGSARNVSSNADAPSAFHISSTLFRSEYPGSSYTRGFSD